MTTTTGRLLVVALWLLVPRAAYALDYMQENLKQIADEKMTVENTIFDAYESELSPKEIKKRGDTVIGLSIAFKGRIIEIVEQGAVTVARVDSGGTLVFVAMRGRTEFVDGDAVGVVGLVSGFQDYTSQARWNVRLPSVAAVAITTTKQFDRLWRAAKLRDDRENPPTKDCIFCAKPKR